MDSVCQLIDTDSGVAAVLKYLYDSRTGLWKVPNKPTSKQTHITSTTSSLDLHLISAYSEYQLTVVIYSTLAHDKNDLAGGITKNLLG